ncbi:phage portal protein [Desulfosarcina sp. OttesenSCG-928-A07]|nr:phage portal protein [Desulfosarcina sp. OttesenSCG-928-G17]MDL2329077.1 phage portal protein [Desulfosarcina sp. OttesenSCG-928-A07]
MKKSLIVDHRGNPIHLGRISTASKDSGAFRGSISNWRPRRVISDTAETNERVLTQDRAEDLYTNDFAARSTVDTIAGNAVGTGLSPQPRIPYRLLGITEEQAYDVKEQMEWNWHRWCGQAHANGGMHFEDLQYSAIVSLLRSGELLHLPTMIPDDEFDGHRFLSHAIQPLSPKRLRTPADKISDPLVRDGIQRSPSGKPIGYWIASPSPTAYGGLDCIGGLTALTSADFRYIPARVAHRPGIFHVFRYGDEDEPTRGRSILSTGVKLYRNLGDAIDYELLAQVIAASFPVFIASDGGRSGLPPEVLEQYGIGSQGDAAYRYYQTVDAGQILYGNPGEKPEVLESNRPSQNFLAFEELVLRAAGSAAGISYESIMKDFSKSNYSSARAALNEDWKTFRLYRSLFARHYCHPNYCMVQEEAYLRGELRLPAVGLDFYDAMHLWTNAYWYGPKRGFVDPVKEIQGNLLAIANRLMTRTEHWAEAGGDFWEAMDQIDAEEKRMAKSPGMTPIVNVNKNTIVDNPGEATNADD